MCAFFNVYNYPFKWITYLVLTIGIYTFLYWFLAIPLLYFHFYECCNEKWPRNWIVWFLTIAFASWLGISVLIIFVWFCLRFFKVRHLYESNVRLTEKKECINPESEAVEKAKKIFFEKNKFNVSNNSLESLKETTKETVDLPEFDPKSGCTVLQINDNNQENENSISGTEFPIPVDEIRHYVQNDASQLERQPEEVTQSEKPLKTPREIFFKDLIESAPKSPLYFDFDPEKISQDIKKKYELEGLKEKKEEEQSGKENNYFVASHVEKPNLTSEVLITLSEKGLVVDEPVVLGNFKILKE